MDQQIRTSTLGGSRVQRVRDVDFRRPMKFTRDQLRVLERAHDGFCRSASSRMSAELRSEIALGFLASDQLPYSTVVTEELPQQAYVLVLEADPIGTRMAMVIEIPTILSLVSRSLGGSMAVPDHEDGLTELEITVAQRSLSGLVESLSDTWKDLCGVTFRPVEAETSPVAVQLVPPSEPTLLLSFSADIEARLSMITLLVPWRSVDPVLEIISKAQQDIKDDPGIAGGMARALGRVNVDVVAELGSRKMEVGELLALQPGDTLVLPHQAEKGVDLLIGDVTLYKGQQGIHESRRAVQITERIERR